MELDSIKQIIQDFFQENTLTVVGSGPLLQKEFLECLRCLMNYKVKFLIFLVIL